MHDPAPEPDPTAFPNADIRISDRFLEDNQQLLMVGGLNTFRYSLETSGAVDLDVREALEALIRTYRTRETGLVYDTRPSSPIASAIAAGLEGAFQQYRDQVRERTGMNSVRDADILGVLVFLQRLEISNNNGRRRSRAFLDFLREQFRIPANVAQASPLIS